MKPSQLLSSAVPILALLAPAALAQGGPWRDGELITRLLDAGTYVLNRVDPATGVGSTLTHLVYPSGWSGALAFEPWRGEVIGNLTLLPDAYTYPRLWRMWPSGAAVSIPGFDGDTVRALAATGDGRVFLMRHPANGPVLWIDRDDRTHTLLDASGTAPFTFPAEHLLFDPAGNALIASTSGGWTPQPACATNVCSFFRIPLSADGKRVGGPVTCNSYATSSQEVMSLDLLPNGFVLATVASGAPFSDPKLITVDPLTLAIQPFASPGPGDLDGGYWSDALGAAVVLDDAANVLRAYAPGAGGLGTVISTSVAVSDFTSGYSPVEGMWQVDVAGPGCPGWADLYGAPLFGSAGFSPWLTLRGCPALGEKLGLVLSRALGGAPGLIAVGLAPAATPFLGGTLLVDPSATLIPVQTLGTAGVAGAGGFDLPVKITAPVLVGVPLYLQVFVADPGAPQGVSLTNGLELVLG